MVITILPDVRDSARRVDDSTFARQREVMDHSNLDDPAYAAFAWGRYRRILGWMAMASLAAVGVSLWLMDRAVGPLNWQTITATSAGVFATMMLGAGLMGLVFLSHGSGHDDSIHDPFEDLAP